MALVPLALGLPRTGGLSSWPRNACVRGRALVGDGYPGLRYPGSFSRGEGRALPGSWAVLFVRAEVKHPARALTSSPFLAGSIPPSTNRKAWAPGDCDFGADYLRPTRLRTYASPAGLRPSAQGSLPTCRARLWSDGFRTRWTTNWISRSHRLPPVPPDQPCLVALEFRIFVSRDSRPHARCWSDTKTVGWPREVSPPGLPQIRTCALTHPAPRGHGFAVRR